MKKSSFLIVGKHAVAEALKNPKRKVLRVFLHEESKKNLNRENQDYNLLKDIKFFFLSHFFYLYKSFLIKHGAGEGNRTLTTSLEGWCSTIELHPQHSKRITLLY